MKRINDVVYWASSRDISTQSEWYNNHLKEAQNKGLERTTLATLEGIAQEIKGTANSKKVPGFDHSNSKTFTQKSIVLLTCLINAIFGLKRVPPEMIMLPKPMT